MCTALSFHQGGHYFGRNLDLEYSLKEKVAIIPRRYPLPLGARGELPEHYAMIGACCLMDAAPLLYDAVNEHGLGMAGLHFPDYAAYSAPKPDRDNVPSFALIPYLLGVCRNVQEARKHLARLHITDEAFSPRTPPSPLHWMLCDRDDCLVVEQTADGLHVWDNPVRVLTNNPPFPWHLTNLSQYLSLTNQTPEARFFPGMKLKHYSRGMGGVGLPGDCTSASRFVRAAFMLHHAQGTPSQAVAQFFHMLDAVSMPRGSVIMPDGRAEITMYSSCCDTQRGIYYYKTYDGCRICAVDMHRENLDGDQPVIHPMQCDFSPLFQN